MSKLYVVHVLNDDGELLNVSYTDDFDLADQYAQLHGLSKKHILVMSDAQFDKYIDTLNPDKVSIDEIQEIEGVAVTIGELEWISNEAADTVYDIMTSLSRIRISLKYFKGKEIEDFKKAIDKFVKKIGQSESEFSDNLHKKLRKSKFAKNALLDFVITDFK